MKKFFALSQEYEAKSDSLTNCETVSHFLILLVKCELIRNCDTV